MTAAGDASGRDNERERELAELFRLDDETWIERARIAKQGDPDPGTPKQIGPYTVLGEVARGGQGIVYRAREATSGEDIALKRLHGGASEHARARFDREMAACARLQHPNIVRLHGLVRDDADRATIAMDWIDGINFLRWARPEGQAARSADEIVRVFLQICDGVGHAHAAGIVHRDLKPSNVLIERHTDTPRIVDFGIAKSIDSATETTSFTRTSIFVGTIRYAAPEQLQSQKVDIDARCDIYALGVMLHEALTGEAPYDTGTGLAEAVRAITIDEPAQLPSAVPRSTQLDRVLYKCMAKQPSRRYADCRALREDLERYVREDSVRAPRRRRRLPVQANTLAISGIAVLAIAAVITWALLTQRSPKARVSAFVNSVPHLGLREIRRDSEGLAQAILELPLEAQRECDLATGTKLAEYGWLANAAPFLQRAARNFEEHDPTDPRRVEVSIELAHVLDCLVMRKRALTVARRTVRLVEAHEYDAALEVLARTTLLRMLISTSEQSRYRELFAAVQEIRIPEQATPRERRRALRAKTDLLICKTHAAIARYEIEAAYRYQLQAIEALRGAAQNEREKAALAAQLLWTADRQWTAGQSHEDIRSARAKLDEALEIHSKLRGTRHRLVRALATQCRRVAPEELIHVRTVLEERERFDELHALTFEHHNLVLAHSVERPRIPAMRKLLERARRAKPTRSPYDEGRRQELEEHAARSWIQWKLGALRPSRRNKSRQGDPGFSQEDKRELLSVIDDAQRLQVQRSGYGINTVACLMQRATTLQHSGDNAAARAMLREAVAVVNKNSGVNASMLCRCYLALSLLDAKPGEDMAMESARAWALQAEQLAQRSRDGWTIVRCVLRCATIEAEIAGMEDECVEHYVRYLALRTKYLRLHGRSLRTPGRIARSILSFDRRLRRRGMHKLANRLVRACLTALSEAKQAGQEISLDQKAELERRLAGG